MAEKGSGGKHGDALGRKARMSGESFCSRTQMAPADTVPRLHLCREREGRGDASMKALWTRRSVIFELNFFSYFTFVTRAFLCIYTLYKRVNISINISDGLKYLIIEILNFDELFQITVVPNDFN